MAKSEDAGAGKIETFKVTAENYRGVTDAEVSGAFTSLDYDHDPVAADNLIRYFHYVLQEGALFSNCRSLGVKERTFLEFVSYAFGRYVENKSVTSLDAAFGLAKTRGQRNTPDNSDRDLAIACKVEILFRKEEVKQANPKMEPIYKEAAVGTNVKWKSVEKIYAAFANLVRQLNSKPLSLLAENLNKSA